MFTTHKHLACVGYQSDFIYFIYLYNFGPSNNLIVRTFAILNKRKFPYTKRIFLVNKRKFPFNARNFPFSERKYPFTKREKISSLI